MFDRHHFGGVLGTVTLLYEKFAAECRGTSAWWRGGAAVPMGRLVAETGIHERTLRRWIAALEQPRPAAPPDPGQLAPVEAPRPYLRVWRGQAGLVVLVVERISFDSGRGRKADTDRYLDPAFVPRGATGDKSVRDPGTNVSGEGGQKCPGSPARAVPEDAAGQGALPLGPLGAYSSVRSSPLVQQSSAPSPFGLRSAADAAPSSAPESTGIPTPPPDPEQARTARALQRVLAGYPGLPAGAGRQALAGALQAARGEARGVGAEALAHGFRCALDAVARYAAAGGAGGPALRGSTAALVPAVIPGEATRWNGARAELAHEAVKAEERELASGFMDRVARLVDAGLEYGEACAIAARPGAP